MKALLLPFIILTVFCGTGYSQNAKIGNHPFFASLLEGSWTESGEILQPQGSVPGSSTSEARAILNGHWIQQDGEALFGSLKWNWRWMFSLAKTKDGKEVIRARYIDTNGQTTDYVGEFISEGKILRLLHTLSEDTKSVVQVANKDDGSRLIEVAIVDKEGKVTLQYRAIGKKDS